MGIRILRDGLNNSDRKCFIAEDLGYILRDEGRTEEAITAFRYSADEGPSSEFIYLELMQLYDEIGDAEKVEHYRELAKPVIEIDQELYEDFKEMDPNDGLQ